MDKAALRHHRNGAERAIKLSGGGIRSLKHDGRKAVRSAYGFGAERRVTGFDKLLVAVEEISSGELLR